ncbi:hypothetical protein ACIA58_00305 [Kribbella sp. NPDC051586]|uniref:hypothetical protein n=1 Tax=Kribbella sp. NPDC051586 TaxID=3364118 RepID=UPI003790FC38
MSTWADVGRIALALPAALAGRAHEGSPAYDVAGHQFARLRRDDDNREILQFWTTDDREALAGSNPEAYWLAKAFPSAVFAHLDALAADELREIVTDSWRARAPKRLLKAHPEIG